MGNMKIQEWMGGRGSKNEKEKRKFIEFAATENVT
jgi:hypothetical protein